MSQMVPLSIWEAFKPMHEAVKCPPCEKCIETMEIRHPIVSAVRSPLSMVCLDLT